MTETLNIIETEILKESILHSLDGRVKLIFLMLIIFYAVFSTQIIVLVVLEAYLLLLIYLSTISFKRVFMRILLLLPFTIFIIAFQPFITHGTVIYALPFGINITFEGILFGALLFSRIIVTLTSVVILSSISSMQEVVDSFLKLGMPRDFAMILSLTIRFLYMFYDELTKITNAQKSRNFDIFNKKTTYMWRLKQLGYTIMMMFLRSYEHGDSIYMSMLSRGYSDESKLYNYGKRKIGTNEYVFISTTLVLIICLQILAMFLFSKLGIWGMIIVK
ncbi:MAG: cobalt ECF transporter T component CbiQ [Methanobacterium sp.]|uniref:cobalt ECF transporter T component CbiQ n=1 Tax=Methanobacterium sp. TaxID=2164 RepID=UPI003D658C01|nr:cobalt ECF transporter T component CbiQ [Methanobacterium sp.]